MARQVLTEYPNDELERALQQASFSQPADSTISTTLSSYDASGVHSTWVRALERRDREAEGAITLARTLLEEVCKHIIEEAGETYAEKDELPKLYRSAAIILKLAPDQHTEDTFKRVLGGCQVWLKDWEQCGTSFATHMVVGGSRSDQRPGTLLLR